MKIRFAKFFATLLSFILIGSLLAPATVFAQTGTLGKLEKKPHLYLAFYDEEGTELEGDHLPKGEYALTVDVMLKNMPEFSIFQITGDYGVAENSIIQSLDVVSTLADENSAEVSCGGVKNEDNRVVVILASENDDCTAINKNGTVMATLTVSISSDSDDNDFQSYFRFVTDPDLTFIEADYNDVSENGDEYEDAYVLDITAETTYKTYEMTADESPDLSNSNIEGQIVIACAVLDSDENGVNYVDDSAYTKGIGGITVSVQVGEETISATSDSDTGDFVLENVPTGTYSASITGPTAITRNVTLVVEKAKEDDGVIRVGIIPLCVCDYDGNGSVTPNDASAFFNAVSGTTENPFADLDGNGSVTPNDASCFFNFVNQNTVYYDVTL